MAKCCVRDPWAPELRLGKRRALPRRDPQTGARSTVSTMIVCVLNWDGEPNDVARIVIDDTRSPCRSRASPRIKRMPRPEPCVLIGFSSAARPIPSSIISTIRRSADCRLHVIQTVPGSPDGRACLIELVSASPTNRPICDARLAGRIIRFSSMKRTSKDRVFTSEQVAASAISRR